MVAEQKLILSYFMPFAISIALKPDVDFFQRQSEIETDFNLENQLKD